MILDHAQRSVVLFNPANKEHREHYAMFLRNRSWGKCPIRFEVQGEASNNNLSFAIQRMLVEYYTGKEFK